MRVTLKELRSLVRIETKKVLFENRTGAKTKKTSVLTKESINKMVLEEIKKILKENVDPVKMKEFREKLETDFNEWAKESSSYGTGYGIVEYLKKYLQDYANNNRLQLTDAYSDLDHVIDYDSKQDPDSEFGEPGNISGTFTVGDGASGEFSSYGDGYDFDASIEINDDFWPFEPLH